MKRYMVITVCEREIGGPVFFKSFLKAQIYLFKLFCENCKIIDATKWEVKIHDENELEDTIEALANNELLNDENDYNYTDAWCETANHDNWDGKVIEVFF